METMARAVKAPPLHARRRRPPCPASACGPKRRAFRVGDGEPAEASHALSRTGMYEYGCRAVHRKRLPGAPPTEDDSWYFAFDPRRREAIGGCDAELTLTHAMMRAVLWDKRFVRCTIEGEPFSAELTDVVLVRPDLSAHAIRASDPRLNGRALDVEIAVTNVVRAYERFGEVLNAGRVCLELCVDRDERREADPNALEAYLRGALLSGAFAARWIVAPDGTSAQLKPAYAVRRRLVQERTRAQAALVNALRELANAQGSQAGTALAHEAVRRAEEHLGQVAECQHKLDDLEDGGVGELLFPPGTSVRATVAYEHRRRFGTMRLGAEAPL